MIDSIVLEQPSSSSTVTTGCRHYGGNSGSGGGGRAIDRHNPIIRDEKRLTQNPTSTVTITTPNQHHQKNKNSKKTATGNLTPVAATTSDKKKKNVAFSDDEDKFINIDNITRPSEVISPETSSRYLLSNNSTFDFSSEFRSVLPPPSPPIPPPPPPSSPPCELLNLLNGNFFEKKYEDSPPSSPPKQPPPLPPPEVLKFYDSEAMEKKDDDPPLKPPSSPPSPRYSDQVVVLEVSLHCRGCERKMKKHISKIEGVKSFKIEFEAKKVTVVGNITPLAVLTSVLKVKNAKLLTPATISSSSDRPLTDSSFSKIKKQLGIMK